MNNNKNLPGGLFIFIGVSAAMIALTVLQIALPEIGWFPLFIRTNVINILLGMAGMGLLLYQGNKVSRKLTSLEELIQPLEKKDYSALASLKPQDAGEESHTELKKSLKDMGVFVDMFKTHANGNANMEKLLTQVIKAAKDGTRETTAAGQPINESLARCLGEIESAVEQAVSALEQVENFFSSISEMGRGQNRVIEELDARLTTTAELEQSMAATIEESGKNAGDLWNKINDGEGHSRVAYNIINEASKDLDKITEIVRMINKTSQQTNILSMNAAIESAHAGAAGAGFAVVADEIRKLAESNSANAKNIQAVLLGITKQITEALKASEVSSNAFSLLTTEITKLVESLDTVADNARKSNDTRARMKIALTESSGGTGKIQDNAVDVATFMYSFRSALEHIQQLCEPAKTGAMETAGRPQKNLETALDKVLEYLKETEELEGMLSPGAAARKGIIAKRQAGGSGHSPGRDVAVKSPPKTVS